MGFTTSETAITSFVATSLVIDIQGATVTVFVSALETRTTPTVATEARTAVPVSRAFVGTKTMLKT